MGLINDPLLSTTLHAVFQIRSLLFDCFVCESFRFVSCCGLWSWWMNERFGSMRRHRDRCSTVWTFARAHVCIDVLLVIVGAAKYCHLERCISVSAEDIIYGDHDSSLFHPSFSRWKLMAAANYTATICLQLVDDVAFLPKRQDLHP